MNTENWIQLIVAIGMIWVLSIDSKKKEFSTNNSKNKMDKKSNQPAFPTMFEKQKGFNKTELETIPGMTIRDYFAAAALQGMELTGGSIGEAAKYAYEYADAMLEARSNNNQETGK